MAITILELLLAMDLCWDTHAVHSYLTAGYDIPLQWTKLEGDRITSCL